MPIKKSTYSVGDEVRVRLYYGLLFLEHELWLSGKITEINGDTYTVWLYDGRVLRDIEPKDLRKG